MSEARFLVRIWVPDHPGVLGAVAARIGAMQGNVVGFEVLEHGGGVAVDELTVELPGADLVDEMSAQIRLAEGAGVEDVLPVPPGTEERGMRVMGVAVDILETAHAEAALAALLGHTYDLFGLDWAVLLDPEGRAPPRVRGQAPPVAWLVAFANGARAGVGAGTTERSGVLAEVLESAGLTLCVGREAPFRRRERHEVELLARATDRAWAALGPARLARPGW